MKPKQLLQNKQNTRKMSSLLLLFLLLRSQLLTRTKKNSLIPSVRVVHFFVSSVIIIIYNIYCSFITLQFGGVIVVTPEESLEENELSH